MSIKNVLIVIVFLLLSSYCIGQDLYNTNNATIRFVSEAPLEIIKAGSDNCQGILSIKEGKFVFRIFIKTFEGFNNSLQRVHFYENYMETSRYPEAIFEGLLVEEIDIQYEGSQLIRAKGDLTIHGVTKEKIIEVILQRKDTFLKFKSEFIIDLKEFNIDIPNIVKQKIAENINILVEGSLEPR